MTIQWKSVLHDYINTHNQMEINYTIQPILPIVSDSNYINIQRKRLQTVKEWHENRGVVPLKSITRYKILNLQEVDTRVVTDLAFKLQAIYKLKNKKHIMERIDRETVTLKKTNQGWEIIKIDVLPQEKFSSPPYSKHALPKQRSVPFLNHHLVSASQYQQRNVKYDRFKVKQYADQWWDHANPEYIHFDVDCTNYVSQCLYAGNAPMNYTGRREQGWWYQGEGNHEQWSFSWSVSHSLQWFLAGSKSHLRADRVTSAKQLTIGDVIIYDWDGNSNYQHSTIVAAMDADGMPLVNAHTANSKHRYWDYRDSYAWSENTQYRFFHIHDTFQLD